MVKIIKDGADPDLLIKIAELYYERNCTQQQIAHELRMSRSNVQRLLQIARDEGIVQIRIIRSSRPRRDLEAALVERLGLVRAIVIPEPVNTQNMINRNLVSYSAKYISDMIQTGDIVGIGWGTTIHGVVANLGQTSRQITCVPLSGGLGQLKQEYQINEMSRLFAEAFGCIWVPLHAPSLIMDEKLKKSILSEPSIDKAVSLWGQLDVLIAGIGTMENFINRSPIFSVLTNGNLAQSINEHLRDLGAVGNVCDRYFDINGKICPTELDKMMLAITPEQLRMVNKSIGVAGGANKVKPIIAAARSRCINILITDEATAELAVATLS